MKSRRGILGSLFSMFWVTIAIVVILAIFVLASGVIREADKSSSELKIYSLNETGLGNIRGYVGDYGNLIRARFLVESGKSIEDSLEGAGYEK